jgi:hypothetical protein
MDSELQKEHRVPQRQDKLQALEHTNSKESSELRLKVNHLDYVLLTLETQQRLFLDRVRIIHLRNQIIS